jgi:hypothetical protein
MLFSLETCSLKFPAMWWFKENVVAMSILALGKGLLVRSGKASVKKQGLR